MARDLARAQDWLNINPANWLGPEMGWDYKKLPGPLYYWLMAPLKLFNSVIFILFVKSIAVYCVLLMLTREIKKMLGENVLIDFLLLFSLMPVYILTSRNLWNPSLIVLFNSLQLIFFLKFLNSPRVLWIWLMTTTAFVGMQVHFSILVMYSAIVFTILSSKQIERKIKIVQLAVMAKLIVWLIVWYFFNFVPEFNTQLSNFYGSNPHLLERLFDLSYHISLNILDLKDYDLFTLFFKTLSELGLIASGSVKFLSVLLNIIYFALLAYGLANIIASYRKNRKPFDFFLLLHFLFFIISILILKNKEQVPYRYGLCLYPIQFIIISYGLHLGLSTKGFILQKVRYIFVFTFIFYAYFNFKMIQAQEVSGRSHHTNNDNLELNLKNKQYLYDFLIKNVHMKEDPFNYLHGRAVNKFRLKEMNWAQTIPYFSLYTMRTGNQVKYSEEIKREQIQDNWLVQLKNLNGLKSDPSNALQITEMSSETLPKKLKISYFSRQGKMLLFENWHNSALIMPSAFVKNLKDIDIINLDFYAESGTYPYLNLLVDDNARYWPAYEPNYEVLDVKANNVELTPKKYLGYFLVQNQYVYKLNPINNTQISIRLKLKVKTNNFSRIDIFLTETELPQEEIYIRTEQE
ncbi:glycosyltransferase family 39 protein [bacterium]|nr:glycosyltransferase family 39 protein [bacterium]